MSHVIPLWLFQVLKSDRWNCNVFLSPKKSEGTQITCDFWGGRGWDEAGGRDEVGVRLRIVGTWWAGFMRWLPKNVARNSPVAISSFEIGSLELQRFLES